MMKKNNLIVIPARGGSTRIFRKNIIDFFGKPIIYYTIKACSESGVANRVVVSTDDEEIAEISRKYGASVPFLRDKYADSNTPVSEAVLYAAEQAEQFWNEKYDNVIMAMANCPIRNSNDIKMCYNNFLKNCYQSQVSCFKFGFMNPWWAMTLEEGVGTKVLPQVATNDRSQDLDDLYCPTGAVWISTMDHLKQYKSFYGDHHFFEISWMSAVDIDNYEDLELAKAVYLLKSNR